MMLSPSPLPPASPSGRCGYHNLVRVVDAAWRSPVAAGMLGLPETLLLIGGAVLLPFAALVAYLSLRPNLPRVAVWGVILVNVLWAAESVLLLMSGWVTPNAAGYVFVLAQAAVVLMYAELQYMGVRRSTIVMA